VGAVSVVVITQLPFTFLIRVPGAGFDAFFSINSRAGWRSRVGLIIFSTGLTTSVVSETAGCCMTRSYFLLLLLSRTVVDIIMLLCKY